MRASWARLAGGQARVASLARPHHVTGPAAMTRLLHLPPYYPRPGHHISLRSPLPLLQQPLKCYKPLEPQKTTVVIQNNEKSREISQHSEERSPSLGLTTHTAPVTQCPLLLTLLYSNTFLHRPHIPLHINIFRQNNRFGKVFIFF